MQANYAVVLTRSNLQPIAKQHLGKFMYGGLLQHSA
jgi:hypothetical protein